MFKSRTHWGSSTGLSRPLSGPSLITYFSPPVCPLVGRKGGLLLEQTVRKPRVVTDTLGVPGHVYVLRRGKQFYRYRFVIWVLPRPSWRQCGYFGRDKHVTCAPLPEADEQPEKSSTVPLHESSGSETSV